MQILDVLTTMAQTGRLGPVSVGATWNHVTAALGKPWDVGTLGGEGDHPRLFAYGDLELSVCRCRKVALICVQTWRDAVEFPAALTGGTGIFPADLRYSAVVSTLDTANCRWGPYPPLTFDNQCTLAVPATGAHFTFEVVDAGEPVLNVMSLPGDGHDCPTELPL